MGQEPILESVGVTVNRGNKTVLTGVDIAIAAGERFALVGLNGSGKTTLLRALAGLEAPQVGTVKWSGGPLPKGGARSGKLGVLFQNEVASHFTVRELVTLGLALDGPPHAAAKDQVAHTLTAMELEPFADRLCNTLSGGEAQRATLARTMVNRPPLLILDEPTNHLDPARRAALLSWLDRLRGSTAVVLATHDLSLAGSCDRVALLSCGKIIAIGSPHDVLTPHQLEAVLGIRVRRIEDPEGGPSLLQIIGLAAVDT